MYKLDLPKDLAMAATLELRRNREIERQNRIFNSKVRIIGVDKEALDYQVKERKIKEETDAHVHEAYAKDLIRNEKIAFLLDERQKNDRRTLNKAVEEFRQCFQKPESRREFHLNDPRMLKKDLPARISDHDPRLSVSGVQKLVGEDLNQQERHRMQQEQLREWSLQQQEERHRAREEHTCAAKDLIRNEKIAFLLDERQKNDRRTLNKAVEEFRQCFQKPESRREFHLNDPRMLKKDLPARISDHDPRLSVSGVQKLVGEDLNQQERHRMQQEQLREWSLQQQEERHRAREEHTCAEELYNKRRVELDNRAVELQKIEEETRRAVTVATKDFNLAKAAETREKQKLEKQQEEEDNLVEISNLIQGDLLSENPDQAVSVFGPHRVVPDRWKGMRPEQLKEITHFQLQQVQENMRSKEREQLCDLEWKQQRVDSARKALLLERQQARLERELRRALDNTNKQLSEAHRAQEKQKLEKQQEEEDNLVEISNLIQGDLLSENPDQAVSVFGPHRVVPDRWKGMRPEQLKEITHFQLQQVQENMAAETREKQKLEKQQEEEDNLVEISNLIQGDLLSENPDQAVSVFGPHRVVPDRKQYLEKEVFTNIPEDGYFAQFNTTSR
ncbi:UNVERIFIED_CONTAM: hypothetical protein FKN15_032770 [Acipenser sinensis]